MFFMYCVYMQCWDLACRPHIPISTDYTVVPARFSTYLASANNTNLVSNTVAQLWEKA